MNRTIDYILLGSIAVIIALSIIFLYLMPDTYHVFVAEDGLVEWFGTLALFAAATLSFYRIFKLRTSANRLFLFCLLLTAFLFIFGGGEEISWGQRIFHIKSSEFFKEHNAQSETNLHNLQIGDVKLNKAIFSKFLVTVIILYLLALPYLYRKSSRIKKLADTLAVPIPQKYQIIAFFVMGFAIELLKDSRRWEVLEMGGAIIFLLILINPLNREIFQPQKSIMDDRKQAI